MISKMNEAKIIIDKFNEEYNPDFILDLDYIESYEGRYKIWLTEPICHVSCGYVFNSVEDLKDWAENVCLY